jgi:hypothetical protein
MNRVSLLLVASLVACGGSKPNQKNLAPLPPDKPVEQAKQEDPKPEPKPEPPKPLPPLEVKVEIPATTVKLVNAGKGKKAPLRYTAKAGAKQGIEMVMSFAQIATVGDESQPTIVPTIILTGQAEAKAVDAEGKTEYALAVSAADAREEAGTTAVMPIDQFKAMIGSFASLVITGNVGPDGLSKETVMRIEKPDRFSAGAVDLVRATLPTFPVFPKEAVGVGAKWQSTQSQVLKAGGSDKGIELVYTTDYELVSKAGGTTTIKSKTAVSGKDQEYKGGKISKIGGSGTSEIKLDDGALYPSTNSALETNLVATEGDKSLKLAFQIKGAVTAKK